MAKSNYDDLNFMGQSLDEGSKSNLTINNSLNSLVFLISLTALSLIGVVFVYSASFPTAQELELSEFSFAIKQLIFVAFGLSAGALLLVFPNRLISISGFLFTVIGIAALGVNLVIENSYISSEVVFNLILLSTVNYLSSYFARRKNNLSKLRELLVPVIVVMAVLLLLVFQVSLTQTLIFFLVVICTFAAGGVGFGIIITLILFALVPFTCSVISNPDRINKVLEYFVNVKSNIFSDSQSYIRIEALTSGGFLGRGLGAGQYKYSLIEDIYGKFVFCNIGEETGYLGVCILMVVFAVFLITGLKASINARKKSLYSANLITCLVFHILISFAFNILSCIGTIPFKNISLPFISFGPGVIVNIIEGMLIYKLSKSSESDFENTESKTTKKIEISGVDYDQVFN